MTNIKWIRNFATAALILFSSFTQAEQCWQISGCDNVIGWFRVNKYSFDIEGKNTYEQSSSSLFGTKTLPLVNSVVEIKRLAKLRFINWADPNNIKCHDYEYAKNDIPELCSLEDAHYDYIGSTAVVRVLGYHKGLHLFALVQIVSYPKNPFKVQSETPSSEDKNII